MWTAELLAELAPLRGLTPPGPAPSLEKAWAKLSERAAKVSKVWKDHIKKGKPFAAELEAAFERLSSKAPLAPPGGPEGEVGVHVIAQTITDWRDQGCAPAVMDYWVATRGLAFAVEAAALSLPATLVNWTEKTLGLPKQLGQYQGSTHPLEPWLSLRGHVARAAEPDYQAARALAERLREGAPDVQRAYLAYAFPSEPWADELLAASPASMHHLLASARDPAVIDQCIQAVSGYQLLGKHSEDGAASLVLTILASAGASDAVVGTLLALLDKLPGAEYRRGAAQALSHVATEAAVTGLVARSDSRDVTNAARAAVVASGPVGLAAAASVAASRSKAADTAKQLVAGLVRTAPAWLDDAIERLPEASKKLAQSLRDVAAPKPEAPESALPPALAKPRWIEKRRAAPPAVLALEPLPFERSMRWPAGLREAWRAKALPEWWKKPTLAETRAALLERWRVPGLGAESIAKLAREPETAPIATIVQRIKAAKPPAERTYAALYGPTHLDPRFVLPLLLAVPTSHWYSPFGGLSECVSEWQLDTLEAVLAFATSQPQQCLELITPFDAPECALPAARAFTSLKKLRAVGERWLRLHPEAAIVGLLPAALGKPGVDRHAAETALRFLSRVGHEATIMAQAARYGAEAEAARAAVRAMLDFDPLDVLPAKIPSLPDFARPELLPAIVLRAAPGEPEHALPKSATHALLTMLAFSRVDEPYAGLAEAREACTKASLAAFAWELFMGWLSAGAPSKEGWAMAALGVLGDDECARKLAAKVREWPGEAAHARAVAGLDVLAAIGTDVALMHLHGIAQKVKFKGLQEKAREKIDAIAEARGLTPDELADRLVPDLGLDDDGTLTLDFGARTFKVRFDEHLRPSVEGSDGKRLPDLPKPTKSDDAEKSAEATQRWKALKKDVKTLAAQQVLRFELAMCARRRWDASTFRTFLVEHPLVRHLVMRLVWATYGESAQSQGAEGAEGESGGRISAVFRVAEDGSFADVRDEAFDLPDDATVGVVHPLELAPEAAAQMGQVLADYQILQPFKQLGRDVEVLGEQERGPKLLRVKGWKVPTGKVLGLESRGWRRGEPQDGGGIWWMTKPLPGGVEAHLTLDPGIIVGAVAEYPEQTLGEIELYEANAWSSSGKRFDTLDPIVASELLRDLMALRG